MSSPPKKPRHWAWRMSRCVVIGYVAATVGACTFQRRLIYLPDAGPVALPRIKGTEGLREVDLVSKDGVALKAWFWPAPSRTTLLLLHGNAGHRGHRIEWLEALRPLGVGMFILDYRGYGGSEGSPSEEGLVLDAEAAVDWLTSQGSGPIVYLGESLGTGVAVELAKRRPPVALILQSAFTSLVDVARAHYAFLPVRLLLRDRFDSLSKIAEVRCPTLLIHGTLDALVPFSHSEALRERAGGACELFALEGADHNDPLWLMHPEYLAAIRRTIP